MAKTGKNRPCPCGSGKKYKMCCMTEEEKSADAAKHYFQNSYDFFPSFSKENKNPQKSAPDEIIDAWWRSFNTNCKDKNGRAIIESLNEFFDEYPEKVPDMDLEYEVIFELYPLVFEDRALCSDYMDLLKRIRDQFQELHLKIFGFIDLVLVEDALQAGRETKELLEYFYREPAKVVNYYEKLLKLFILKGKSAELKALLDKTAFIVSESLETINAVFGVELLFDLLIFEFIQKADSSPEAISLFMRELDAELQPEIKPEFILEIFEYSQNYKEADLLNILKIKRGEFLIFIFANLLFEEKNYTALQALYIGRLLAMFFLKQKSERPFLLSEKEIETFLAENFSSVFELSYLDSFAFLKGLYDLQDCMGNFSHCFMFDDDMTKIICKKLFKKVQKITCETSFGRRLFEGDCLASSLVQINLHNPA
jgi:hypothetical protein